ncbi:MAG: TIGR03905 family TSCPD domain-containing protein [Firmicutes bacterium]|nr:TIGR03905 family TSCPD domain-containing protein [Bacillota bacterium]
MDYSYKTSMVCANRIDFRLEGDRVYDIRFNGGCNGNLKAISKLVDGWRVQDIEDKLLGNTCGGKPTSCADQLARAVRQALDASASQAG